MCGWSNRDMRKPGIRSARNGLTYAGWRESGTYKENMEKHAHIRRATAIVHAAIVLGKLCSPKLMACVDCDRQATEYDHRDYNKPLDVEPVCHSCNIRRGPGIRPFGKYKPRRERELCNLGHPLDGIRTRDGGGRYCRVCVKLNKRKQRANK